MMTMIRIFQMTSKEGLDNISIGPFILIILAVVNLAAQAIQRQ